MSRLKYTVIKDNEQYNKYCDILESLVYKNFKKYEEEIELLSLLIERYDDMKLAKYSIEMNPVELLKDLLKENEISQTEIANRLKVSKQLINDVLKYRREITKNLAHKLADEFAMNFAVFLKPYKVKLAS